MFTLKQILELKQKCEICTQYHKKVYSYIVSEILSNKYSLHQNQIKIWLKGTYIPKDNIELSRLLNELIDDGFNPSIEYFDGNTYLRVKWN